MNKKQTLEQKELFEFKRDVFSPDLDFEFSEASSEVDGKYVIGRVRGTFFVPEGFSRNNRFYSKGLWEKVITNEQVQERLSNKRMFGTVGHDLPIDDKALREGLVSHIVTKLEINESGGKMNGIGEALILDTPAGRSLNTALRAGCKLFTSSRAYGRFQGHEKGVPKVDEDSYKFDTFDFVLDPGFAEANPQLVEQLGLLNNTTDSSNQGDDTMDKEFLEKVLKQNAEMTINLNKAIAESEELNKKLVASVSENETLKGKVAEFETSAKTLTESAEGAAKASEAKLAEVSEKLAATEASLAKYAELGSVEKIGEALDRAVNLLTQYKVLGTPAEVDKALEESMKQLKAYKELGTVKQVSESLDKAIAAIESYKEFGTIDELKKVFEKMETMANKMKAESTAKKVKDLAEELKVTEEAVKTLLDKSLTEDEIRKVLKNVSESAAIGAKFKKPEQKIEESAVPAADKKNPIFESSAKRLMGSFGNKN